MHIIEAVVLYLTASVKFSINIPAPFFIPAAPLPLFRVLTSKHEILPFEGVGGLDLVKGTSLEVDFLLSNSHLSLSFP